MMPQPFASNMMNKFGGNALNLVNERSEKKKVSEGKMRMEAKLNENKKEQRVTFCMLF